MKKSIFALFAYLSLVISFSLIIVLTSSEISKISSYKFNIEKKEVEFFNRTINNNFEYSWKLYLDSFKLKHIFSYSLENCKDFIFLCAIKKEDYEKIKNKELNEKYFKENLKKVNFSDPFLITTIQSLINVSSKKYLLSFFKKIKKHYIIYYNSSYYFITCLYDSYIPISLPFYYPLTKEKIEEIPLEICYYEDLNNIDVDELIYNYPLLFPDNYKILNNLNLSLLEKPLIPQITNLRDFINSDLILKGNIVYKEKNKEFQELLNYRWYQYNDTLAFIPYKNYLFLYFKDKKEIIILNVKMFLEPFR